MIGFADFGKKRGRSKLLRPPRKTNAQDSANCKYWFNVSVRVKPLCLNKQPFSQSDFSQTSFPAQQKKLKSLHAKSG